MTSNLIIGALAVAAAASLAYNAGVEHGVEDGRAIGARSTLAELATVCMVNRELGPLKAIGFIKAGNADSILARIEQVERAEAECAQHALQALRVEGKFIVADEHDWNQRYLPAWNEHFGAE